MKQVKKHFRLAGLLLLIMALVYALMGERRTFLIMLSIALELYSLTEMQADWTEKFSTSEWRKIAGKRYRNSVPGSIAGFAAALCMAGFFIYS
jgi:hypothetical protein